MNKSTKGGVVTARSEEPSSDSRDVQRVDCEHQTTVCIRESRLRGEFYGVRIPMHDSDRSPVERRHDSDYVLDRNFTSTFGHHRALQS